VLIWTVVCPYSRAGARPRLAGSYVGGTASATVGVGIGANAPARRLQQFDRPANRSAIEANKGLNVAARDRGG